MGRNVVGDPLHGDRVGVQVPSREEASAVVGVDLSVVARHQDAQLLVDDDVRGADAVVDALRVVACHHVEAGEVGEVELLLAG